MALEALGDDATNEQKRDAQRMVEAAANALRDTLRMNGGSNADIEAAIRVAETARVAAEELQATITAAANAEAEVRMAAINAAQKSLSNAEGALAALDDDATDEQKRDAHREVEMAAEALLQVLEDNQGTDVQIAAATMTRDSAKMMADGLATDVRRTNRMAALTTASGTLTTALGAISGTPTQAQIDAAETALAALNTAIEGAEDLSEAEKAEYQQAKARAEGRIEGAKETLMAANDAAAEEQRKADEAAAAAAAATAAKLYAAIAPASGAITEFTAKVRSAGLVPVSDTDPTANLTVNYGGTLVTPGEPNAAVLMVDKDTMVADHHGWKGKRYVLEDDDGTVTEAVVYSDEMPMQGPEINSGEGDGNVGFELDATTGAVTLTADLNQASRIASPDARVTESADTEYAVYGWWLRTASDPWVASAFDGYHAGTAPAFTGLDALNGSATYTGGAAGKYALSSSTGGTNDAGHFTARAMLEADFDTDTITGTIDQFMGVGGAKDWSVALNKSGVSDAGAIAGDGTDGNTDMQKTVWTRGGTAAAASGQWRGQFQEVDTDSGVPQVVTGDFYTEYGNSGKMVGAFGAKTE